MSNPHRRIEDKMSFSLKAVSLISGVAILVSGICTVGINLGIAYGQTSQRVEMIAKEVAQVEAKVQDNTSAIHETAKAVTKIAANVNNIQKSIERIEKKLDKDGS